MPRSPWSDGWADGFGLGRPNPKQILMHVLSESGVPLTVWDDFLDAPQFSWGINSGLSALTVKLPRAWGYAGEQGESYLPGVVLAKDSFDRTNNSTVLGALDGGVGVGLPWIQQSGTWGINNNQAYLNSATPQATAVVPLVADFDMSVDITLSPTSPVLASEFDIEFDIEFGASIASISDFQGEFDGDFATLSPNLSDVGVIFRGTDDSNYLLVNLSQFVSQMFLYKRIGGVFIPLNSSQVISNLVAGSKHTLRVIAHGRLITVYLDGQARFTHTLAAGESSFVNPTRVGIRISGGASGSGDGGSRFDNFSVSGLPVEDLVLGNRVEIYAVDSEAPEGVLIYKGSIQEYTFNLDSRIVDVILISKTSLEADTFVLGAVVFTRVDPTDMMKYFVQNYMPGITWIGTNPPVGEKYTQTFTNLKLGQAMEMIQKIAGGTWYWRFNPDDTFTFNHWELLREPVHSLIIDKHVSSLSTIVKSRIDRKRRVIVFGAPGVMASNAGPDYNPAILPLDHLVTNSRITDGQTATRLAAAYREFYDRDFVQSTLLVTDNNLPSQEFEGYDLESLKPGDTVRVMNPRAGFAFPKVGDHIVGDGHIIGGTQFQQAQATLVISKLVYKTLSVDLTLQLAPIAIPDQLVLTNDRLDQLGSV